MLFPFSSNLSLLKTRANIRLFLEKFILIHKKISYKKGFCFLTFYF
ncbi:hypothetical protein CAPGI0001_0167 [Capnocytophaga gingivalis ATCC 33624]|nr:hypothetical protein CAPGI0001_0167 [Capnocytophaga gingivalis ATCC 33624]